MKIVLCGPPQSGKSCLRYGLREALKELGSVYPYVITACPDGEGAWFQETYCHNEALATTLKQSYRGSFTEENIALWSSWVTECTSPLCIVDIGGKITDANYKICKDATHAIIIYGDCSKIKEWRTFCLNLGLTIIAEIFSDINATEDQPLQQGEDAIYRGSIHHLTREDATLHLRPSIKQLVSIITQLQPLKQESTMDYMYLLTFENENTLIVKKGTKAGQNDMIVQAVNDQINILIETKKLTGGELLKINGPATLPMSYVIAHRVCHLYQAIAVFDPKINKYVVVITHGSNYQLGDLLDA